jgi:hypothetical protein
VIPNLRLIGSAVGLCIVLASCGATTSSVGPSPAGSISVPTPSAGHPTPEPSATGEIGTPVSQTDTDWGRIWDDLPATFPTIPGSTDGGASAAGPASADLVVEGSDAAAVATLLRDRLEQAGYATEGLSGPLEDGGYVLDMSGGDGCFVQVTARPIGGLTAVTVLYGAGCPFD